MDQKILPLIAVRDLVVFPGSVIPISIKRDSSIAALEEALAADKKVFLSMQKNKDQDSPIPEDLYLVGTIAHIDQIQRLPDGIINVLVTGEEKAKVKAFVQETPSFRVETETIEENLYNKEEFSSLTKPLLEQFRKLVTLGKPVPLDILPSLTNLTSPINLLDIIIANIDLKAKEKQQLLEENDLKKRIKQVATFLSGELSVMSTARKIQDQTAEEIGKNAKEAFLREQLRTIEKELGVKEEKEEYAELEKKIKAADMPEEVETKAVKELDRLKRVPAFSPEVSYIRTYLDLLVELPWSKKTESKIDVKAAEKILNEDHYGLKKVKERILEYLAVKKLTGKIRGPILCFAGPPGVGKTSIGRSIARAMNRKFVKVSLGGIRDEAEIRGHRRTYVGALPGRIIQGVKDAETNNPVFMLDEIDKMGFDFRGDPSAALLEALDPEQNKDFSDHYLEVPFDLSDVVFITTANNLENIPPALRDRMEVIDFPGYTEEEKLHIAKDFLIPKQNEIHGLTEKKLILEDDALKKIITKYTREAGVRNLERELSAVCRKVARDIAENNTKKITVTDTTVIKYLGPEKFQPWSVGKVDEIGVSTGLAWTEAGGEVLNIETALMPGKGSLILTGHLGDVMKESAQAALSFVRSKLSELGIKENVASKFDIHLHVPSGAIPKDGPSAGTAMATSLMSAIAKIPARFDVAMTGEITLLGRVLEIGGVKEKVLAAHRAGIKTVILPKRNEKDLEELPAKTRSDLKFVFVEHMDEVLRIALRNYPTKVAKPSGSETLTPTFPAA